MLLSKELYPTDKTLWSISVRGFSISTICNSGNRVHTFSTPKQFFVLLIDCLLFTEQREIMHIHDGNVQQQIIHIYDGKVQQQIMHIYDRNIQQQIMDIQDGNSQQHIVYIQDGNVQQQIMHIYDGNI